MADVVRYRRFRCFRNLECRKEEDFVSSCRCIDVASVKDDMKIGNIQGYMKGLDMGHTSNPEPSLA